MQKITTHAKNNCATGNDQVTAYIHYPKSVAAPLLQVLPYVFYVQTFATLCCMHASRFNGLISPLIEQILVLKVFI